MFCQTVWGENGWIDPSGLVCMQPRFGHTHTTRITTVGLGVKIVGWEMGGPHFVTLEN